MSSTLTLAPAQRLVRCCECGDFFDCEGADAGVAYHPQKAFLYLLAFWSSDLARVKYRRFASPAMTTEPWKVRR